MAKKKAETTAKTPAARKTSSRKTAKPAAPSAADLPVIDTNLAAEAAAKMLANRAALQGAGAGEASGEPQAESGAFKQLKESLTKPKISTPLLDTTGGAAQKKTNLHSAFNKQTGHNQTYGHFNRAGVPRRTPG